MVKNANIDGENDDDHHHQDQKRKRKRKKRSHDEDKKMTKSSNNSGGSNNSTDSFQDGEEEEKEEGGAKVKVEDDKEQRLVMESKNKDEDPMGEGKIPHRDDDDGEGPVRKFVHNHDGNDTADDKDRDGDKDTDKDKPTKHIERTKDSGEINQDRNGEQEDYDDGESEKEQDEERGNEQPSARRKRKRKRGKKSPRVNTTTRKDEVNLDDEDDDDDETAKLTSLAHTVYIEGIPFDCTQDDVLNFFTENNNDMGSEKRIKGGDILQMRLPRWQDTGRLRGYGHVVFRTTTLRNDVIKHLNGLNLRNRYLTIKEPRQPRPDTTVGVLLGDNAGRDGSNKTRVQPEGCKTVFIKNLPYDATEEDIHNVFRVCGKIVDGGVRLARNYSTRQSKGFGYVEYKNPEGAAAAVAKASKPFGITVRGRPCFVDYDEGGNVRGSFRTREGKLWSKEHRGSSTAGGLRHGKR